MRKDFRALYLGILESVQMTTALAASTHDRELPAGVSERVRRIEREFAPADRVETPLPTFSRDPRYENALRTTGHEERLTVTISLGGATAFTLCTNLCAK